MVEILEAKMIPEIKGELVTARNCVEKYEMLYQETGEVLYWDLCDFATEVQQEHQEVLTQIEKKILV